LISYFDKKTKYQILRIYKSESDNQPKIEETLSISTNQTALPATVFLQRDTEKRQKKSSPRETKIWKY